MTTASSTLAGTRYYRCGSATVAYRTGGAVTWLCGDVQGSAQVSLPKSGQEPVGQFAPSYAAYGPYGDVLAAGDRFDGIDRGWLGQTEDAGTGWTCLNARHYDPMLGRFLSPDPLMNPGDPRTLDPYRYADNNPVMFSDPTGLDPKIWGNGTIAGTPIKAQKPKPTTPRWVGPPGSPATDVGGSLGIAASLPDGDLLVPFFEIGLGVEGPLGGGDFCSNVGCVAQKFPGGLCGDDFQETPGCWVPATFGEDASQAEI